MSLFKFKPLNMEDLSQLHQWFQKPVINYWYARNTNWSLNEIKEKYEPRILGKEHVLCFIVFVNSSPFGFIQYYSLIESLPEGVTSYDSSLFQQYNPKELAGIDLFIAGETDRGKGLGEKLINQFITQFLTGFKAIIVDPNANNQQAIRCYEKSGFQPTKFSNDPNHLIMLRPLSQAKDLI